MKYKQKQIWKIVVTVILTLAADVPQAEQIADDVLDTQSLDVDAIAEATLTSDTVLKAIENALQKGTSQ